MACVTLSGSACTSFSADLHLSMVQKPEAELSARPMTAAGLRAKTHRNAFAQMYIWHGTHVARLQQHHNEKILESEEKEKKLKARALLVGLTQQGAPAA